MTETEEWKKERVGFLTRNDHQLDEPSSPCAASSPSAIASYGTGEKGLWLVPSTLSSPVLGRSFARLNANVKGTAKPVPKRHTLIRRKTKTREEGEDEEEEDGEAREGEKEEGKARADGGAAEGDMYSSSGPVVLERQRKRRDNEGEEEEEEEENAGGEAEKNEDNTRWWSNNSCFDRATLKPVNDFRSSSFVSSSSSSSHSSSQSSSSLFASTPFTPSSVSSSSSSSAWEFKVAVDSDDDSNDEADDDKVETKHGEQEEWMGIAIEKGKERDGNYEDPHHKEPMFSVTALKVNWQRVGGDTATKPKTSVEDTYSEIPTTMENDTYTHQGLVGEDDTYQLLASEDDDSDDSDDSDTEFSPNSSHKIPVASPSNHERAILHHSPLQIGRARQKKKGRDRANGRPPPSSNAVSSPYFSDITSTSSPNQRPTRRSYSGRTDSGIASEGWRTIKVGRGGGSSDVDSGGDTSSSAATPQSESDDSSSGRTLRKNRKAEDRDKGIRIESEWLQKWRIDSSELRLLDLVGTGSFGLVWRGIWRNSEVVVKKLACDVPTRAQYEQFVNEARMLVNLRPHVNVIQFFGISCDNWSEVCLVSEYLPQGDLQQLLRKGELFLDSKVQLAMAVAAGMAHIHREGVLHRDLAARNLLVWRDMASNRKWNIKITDFGLSVMGDGSRCGIGPLKWMPPEAIDPKQRKFSPASDVWSFGVVLWEMLTNGEEPFKDMKPQDAARAILKEGKRLSIPSTCPQPLVSLIQRCWKDNPEERPSFSEIYQELKDIYTDFTASASPDRPRGKLFLSTY